MTPLVSVCVTTYQHAPFIARALDGALQQRASFDVEILVGEDESTDGTREIVSRYAEQHPDRIRAFFRSRRDVIYYDGRPTGRHNLVATLSEARGDLVAFLDGDDFWCDPEKLQRQVECLHDTRDCALCFHRMRVVDETGCDRGEIKPARGGDRYNIDDMLGWLDIPTSSAMVRRSAIPKLGRWYLDLPVGDWPLWVLCAQRGDIAYLDIPMAAYRSHGGGRWSALSTHEQCRVSALTARALRPAVSPKQRARLDERIARIQGRDIYELVRHGQPVAGLSEIARSVRQCRDDGRSRLSWVLTNLAAGVRRLVPTAGERQRVIWEGTRPAS